MNIYTNRLEESFILDQRYLSQRVLQKRVIKKGKIQAVENTRKKWKCNYPTFLIHFTGTLHNFGNDEGILKTVT